MRVTCPKCGFRDSIYWRVSMKWGIDFMRLTDFQNEFPELAKKVRHSKYVEDGIYVYHLTKGKNVERQEIAMNPTYSKSWSINFEDGKHKLPPHLRSVRSRMAIKIKSPDTAQTKLIVRNKVRGKKRE